MVSDTFVTSELCEGVLTLMLNRPKVNALTPEMVQALRVAFQGAAADRAVRCVLLTASGEVFSPGQDVSAFGVVEASAYRAHLVRTYNPLIVQMRRLEKPILAAINGAVSGAALGLVLACDLRLASERARFVVGFGGVGLVPDSGVSLLLPVLIGLGRATELTFTNASLSAEQALAWGLVNRVVPHEQLASEAAAWARQLAQGAIHAMGLAKRAFNRALLSNLEEVLDYEAHLQSIAASGKEHQEGVLAFREKRPPRFEGLEG